MRFYWSDSRSDAALASRVAENFAIIGNRRKPLNCSLERVFVLQARCFIDGSSAVLRVIGVTRESDVYLRRADLDEARPISPGRWILLEERNAANSSSWDAEQFFNRTLRLKREELCSIVRVYVCISSLARWQHWRRTRSGLRRSRRTSTRKSRVARSRYPRRTENRRCKQVLRS